MTLVSDFSLALLCSRSRTNTPYGAVLTVFHLIYADGVASEIQHRILFLPRLEVSSKALLLPDNKVESDNKSSHPSLIERFYKMLRVGRCLNPTETTSLSMGISSLEANPNLDCWFGGVRVVREVVAGTAMRINR